MFNNILVSLVANVHSKDTYETAFTLAKKFDSKITFLKCITIQPPKFGFFETKGEKQKLATQIKEAKESLAALDSLAKKEGLQINTKVASDDSLTHYLTSYVESNHVDLLIMDSPSLSKIEHEVHKDMVNKIYKNVSCPILTLK